MTSVICRPAIIVYGYMVGNHRSRTSIDLASGALCVSIIFSAFPSHAPLSTPPRKRLPPFSEFYAVLLRTMFGKERSTAADEFPYSVPRYRPPPRIGSHRCTRNLISFYRILQTHNLNSVIIKTDTYFALS